MKNILNSKWIFAAAALFIAVGCFFFGQRFGEIGRFGDDKYYVLMAAGFDKLIFEVGINEYRLQRMVPPGLVHYTMKLFQMPVGVENIRFVWSMFNIALCTLIGFVWALIARELQISRRGQWLGFAAIFFNFHMLKYIPFISVSTDLFAYAITLLLVYCYLRNYWVGICFLMLAGSFTWPTISYTAMALLLFPREREEEAVPMVKAPFFLNYVLAAALVIPIAVYMRTIVGALNSGRLYTMGIFSMGSNRPLMNVIYLSMGIVLVYLFTAAGLLFNDGRLFQWRYWKRQFHIVRIVAAVVLLAGIKLAIFYMASAQNARPVMYLITNLLIVGTMQPAVFLVSHTLYFGPVFLFLPFVWRSLCVIIRRQGLGLIICALLIVLFSIDSESRKQMNTYPLILPFLIKALDELKWSKWHYGILGVLMLAASKVWYPIDPVGWAGAMDFPAQSFYMTMGPWISHPMYYLQGGCVLAGAAVIYFGFVYKRSMEIH